MHSNRAKQKMWFATSLCALALLGGKPTQGAQNSVTCYSINEISAENIESSNLILCVSSDDLKKYPRSIVTVTVEEMVPPVIAESEKDRKPSSVKELYAGLQTKLVAKRYYIKTGENEYGRKGSGCKCGVRFNEQEKTVYVGFLDSKGKTFFYKPFKASTASSDGSGEKQQLKTLEARR